MEQKITIKPLTKDDFIPMFSLTSQDGILREIQNYGGKKTVLFFLPLDSKSYLNDFFNHLNSDKKFEKLNFLRVYICKCSKAETANIKQKFNISSSVWSDETGAVHKAFGIENPGKTPLSVVLTGNLKIFSMHDDANAITNLDNVYKNLNDLWSGIAPINAIKMQAPILMVPNVVNEEFRQRLLKYWADGRQYKGTVGGTDNIDLQFKRRTDTDIVDKALLTEIDETLSKTLYPEVRKVAGFTVKYRERYKIGCYTSENLGYYNQHRDTGIEALCYRRYSLVICLGEEYEGGYLQFTEYDNASYKIGTNMALVFPSALLHQVTPVTAGRRFVMVSFLHGEKEEQYRKEYSLAQNKPYNPNDVKILSENNFEGIEESKYLFVG